MGVVNPPSSVLFGANNESNGLQNGILTANGTLLSYNGAKNYITNSSLENGLVTPGYSMAFVNGATPLLTFTPGLAFTAARYVFTIAGTTVAPTIGTTYTNNSQTFTVSATITTTATILVCTGTGVPLNPSGTLTKSTGTGDATIAYTNEVLSTPTNVGTLSVTQTNPLAGLSSLQYIASTSLSEMGNVILTDAVTIDKEDQAKVLQFRFYYNVAVNGGLVFSGTSANSIQVWIYDVANGVWIQPAGYANIIQTTGVGLCSGTFQTASNGTQYQIAILRTDSVNTTFTFLMDDFFLGPQIGSAGAAMTDWVAYTPTFIGFGTATGISFQSRRIGDSLEVHGNFTTGVTTSTPNAISIGYNGSNANVTIDSTKIPGQAQIGVVSVDNVSTTLFGQGLIAGNVSSTTVSITEQTSTISAQAGGINGITIVGNSKSVGLSFKVPIVSWSSNTAQSSDTDTRIIAARATTTAGGSLSNATDNIINFATVTFDNSGSVTTGAAWKFTCPVSGYYQIKSSVHVDAVPTLVNVVTKIFKNGSVYSQEVWKNYSASTVDVHCPISGTVLCNAGDTLQITVNPASGTVTLDTSANLVYVDIERLSGPAVVQATESVNGRYFSSTTTISGSLATIVLATKTKDTHAAYNSTTGIWTCPVSGSYLFSAAIATAGTVALNSALDLQIQQTGSSSQISEVIVDGAAGLTNLSADVTDIFNCIAGDTVKVQVSSGATAPTIVSSNSRNFLSWTRVGN